MSALEYAMLVGILAVAVVAAVIAFSGNCKAPITAVAAKGRRHHDAGHQDHTLIPDGSSAAMKKGRRRMRTGQAQPVVRTGRAPDHVVLSDSRAHVFVKASGIPALIAGLAHTDAFAQPALSASDAGHGTTAGLAASAHVPLLVVLTGSVIGFYFGGRSAAPAPRQPSVGEPQ